MSQIPEYKHIIRVRAHTNPQLLIQLITFFDFWVDK